MSTDKISDQALDLIRRILSGDDEMINSAMIEAEELLAKLSKEDDDPTPYCSGCKAKFRKDCNCGPTAEND